MICRTFAGGSERPDDLPVQVLAIGIRRRQDVRSCSLNNICSMYRGDNMPGEPWSFEVLVSQVGARIRFLRFERGLSLPQIAAKTRYSINKITQVELGQLMLTARMLRRFARALRVQPFDLLNYDPELDDLGYVIEIMRQNPAALRAVKKRIQRAQSALHTDDQAQVNE